MSQVPLRRNRDFMLLQAGELLSSTGTQSTTIAYPLLVLALTHSPARAGIVAFARAVPMALLSLPAGVAADRWNRRTLMIGADLARAVAIGTLAALVVSGRASFWSVAVVAFVEGTGAAVFASAQPGALRAVVPVEQLPEAAAAQTGRQAAVALAGPPLGGALFGLARALPFVVDCVSYVFSTAAVLAVRVPFQDARVADGASLRTRLAEGFTFLWRHPFLRTTALIFGGANFIAPGLLFSVVVIGRAEDLSPAAIGGITATFGVGVLIGSFAAPAVRRRLPARAVLLLELWAWPGCAAFVLWPSTYALAAGMLPAALVVASTDSFIHGHRIAITPDHILGRAEAVRRTISLSMAPLGPLVAGALLPTSERATVALFATAAVMLAVWATASPSLRQVPSAAPSAEGAPPG